MHKYEIIIYWSKEDESYVAEVPQLTGCTAHGDSSAAALDSVNAAIELWLETAKELGREIPEPKGKRLLLA